MIYISQTRAWPCWAQSYDHGLGRFLGQTHLFRCVPLCIPMFSNQQYSLLGVCRSSQTLEGSGTVDLRLSLPDLCEVRDKNLVGRDQMSLCAHRIPVRRINPGVESAISLGYLRLVDWSLKNPRPGEEICTSWPRGIRDRKRRGTCDASVSAQYVRV